VRLVGLLVSDGVGVLIIWGACGCVKSEWEKSVNPQARRLLDWIIDKVIAHRQSKAFLLKSDVNDPLIDALFDARVLPVLKRNIAMHDQPGVRHHVFGIDYGCYVDLLQTKYKAPKGLLALDDADEADDGSYISVPPDDYRAIRRAILSLDEFYDSPDEQQRAHQVVY